MKTIEEKAKAYDEAIEKAKIFKEHLLEINEKDYADEMDYIFSELKESEDERIRNWLIETIKQVPNNSIEWETIDKPSVLAWLEKQGEYQMSTDKVEPRFKVGDFIVNNNSGGVYQVTEIRDDEYCLYPLYGEIMGYLRIIDVDNEYHLWTIQDAKDGDVLATLDYILIFKEFLKNDGGMSYCHYDFGAGNPQFIWSEDKNWYFGKEAIIHPATKEQRELLFQKMEEAGYEWDAEKKELKKIEPTPAWSEEDEINYNYALAACKYYGEAKGYADTETHQKANNWLKSLKEKVKPQNIAYYNPYKEVVESIAEMCKHYDKANHSGLRDFYDNIKVKCKDAKEYDSLYPHNTWKPSDEHYELEEFAKIVRGNLTGISKDVQELFKAKYLQLTGNKMYGGYKD